MRDRIVLAGRNLARHRARTVITASAVAFGLALYILIDSMLVGARLESERNVIWYETGIAQVIHPEYLDERDDRPLRYPVGNAPGIATQLRQAGLRATERTVFGAELIVFRDPYPEDGSILVTAYGVDPDEDGSVFRVAERLAAGTWLVPGELGAVLGSRLASTLGADVGYPLTLVTRTQQGFFQTIDLDVVGIVDVANPVINRTAVFVPIDLANLYLQMEGQATEIAVSGGAAMSLAAVVARAGEALDEVPPGVDVAEPIVVSWRDLVADYLAVLQADEASSYLILFLVFVIAAVGVSNTMLMSLLERTREIGMMRALGMRDREVMGTLLLEAAGIGLLGGILGAVGGAGLTLYLVEVGIDFSSITMDADIGYRIANVFYGAWNPAAYVIAPVAGTIIAVATAIVPVRRALRREIVECLRAA